MMEPYLKYIGAAFIPDVPARDLTKEEAKQFGVDRLILSGLYEPAQKEKLIIKKRTEKEEVNNA